MSAVVFCFCRSEKQISDQQPAHFLCVKNRSRFTRPDDLHCVDGYTMFGTIRAFQSPQTKWGNFSKAMAWKGSKYRHDFLCMAMTPLNWDYYSFPENGNWWKKTESQNDYHFSRVACPKLGFMYQVWIGFHHIFTTAAFMAATALPHLEVLFRPL